MIVLHCAVFAQDQGEGENGSTRLFVFKVEVFPSEGIDIDDPVIMKAYLTGCAKPWLRDGESVGICYISQDEVLSLKSDNLAPYAVGILEKGRKPVARIYKARAGDTPEDVVRKALNAGTGCAELEGRVLPI